MTGNIPRKNLKLLRSVSSKSEPAIRQIVLDTVMNETGIVLRFAIPALPGNTLLIGGY